MGALSRKYLAIKADFIAYMLRLGVLFLIFPKCTGEQIRIVKDFIAVHAAHDTSSSTLKETKNLVDALHSVR